MNYSVILVGITIICLMTIASSGCLGTMPGSHEPVQTPPPTPPGTPVQVQAEHLVLHKEQNNATVNLGLNNTLTLMLNENPTTGFQWNLTTSPGLVVTADNYLPSAPQLTGSGGVHTWEMKAVQTGTQKIKATYMRSWEPMTGNESTFALTVIVANS
ncbi:MAG: protease inhibitor I42 family protein [Methanomicrobiales archaeon]|nr:protease inhibitor I42 family protein [Methanomicrobiales archaeon]